MNVGKTAVTEELIKGLSWQGLKVGGAKITGIACLKDTIRMKNAGAAKTLSFLDCGVPSTVDTDDIAGIARSIVAQMADMDLVVMELGDGIMGHYKVERFFDDRALDGDLTADFDGVTLTVDRMSAPYIQGASIDFVDTIEKQGFTIDNPNAGGSCACGDSFH